VCTMSINKGRTIPFVIRTAFSSLARDFALFDLGLPPGVILPEIGASPGLTPLDI
jgi:hypothetical protein